MNIETRITAPRGCGLRKPGGLYLVAGAPNAPCGKLPLELTVCPCCGQGIKFARGWTWVDADRLFKDILCRLASCPSSPADGLCGCPAASGTMGRAGLIWVGEKFYPTAADFTSEAVKQGISRRIKTIPHGFKVGESYVLFAHIKAIKTVAVSADDPSVTDTSFRPGVFLMFRPTSIEYVVKGTETEDELEKIAGRGIVLVKDVLPADTKPATAETEEDE